MELQCQFRDWEPISRPSKLLKAIADFSVWLWNSLQKPTYYSKCLSTPLSQLLNLCRVLKRIFPTWMHVSTRNRWFLGNPIKNFPELKSVWTGCSPNYQRREHITIHPLFPLAWKQTLEILRNWNLNQKSQWENRKWSATELRVQRNSNGIARPR